MPVHNWRRVYAGLFHHFHQRWISALTDELNAGLLPPGYFALAEQVTGDPVPDVLTLKRLPASSKPRKRRTKATVITEAPHATYVQRAELDTYAAKADRIAIRYRFGNIVAIVEIVSPGNKNSKAALRAFVDKAVAILRKGIHLLIVDLFPPSQRDPQGIHKAIWDEIEGEFFELPADKPLTVVSYSAGEVKTAYVEPIAVGDRLPPMPLFLALGQHIRAPLEETYQTTWSACPDELKEAVEEAAE
jgi:hypothetical protein